MNTPLLVRTYDNGRSSEPSTPRRRGAQSLPPVASFAFAEILRCSDTSEFQSAIDGIAVICAKNRMSLADEYASHLPPQGEITAASSAAARPHLHRPGMRTALTSVPEASSSSSEDSARSRKRKGSLFSWSRKAEQSRPSRTMRIGSMGRQTSITSTTALTTGSDIDSGIFTARMPAAAANLALNRHERSTAACSLQDILNRSHEPGGD